MRLEHSFKRVSETVTRLLWWRFFSKNARILRLFAISFFPCFSLSPFPFLFVALLQYLFLLSSLFLFFFHSFSFSRSLFLSINPAPPKFLSINEFAIFSFPPSSHKLFWPFLNLWNATKALKIPNILELHHITHEPPLHASWGCFFYLQTFFYRSCTVDTNISFFVSYPAFKKTTGCFPELAVAPKINQWVYWRVY